MLIQEHVVLDEIRITFFMTGSRQSAEAANILK